MHSLLAGIGSSSVEAINTTLHHQEKIDCEIWGTQSKVHLLCATVAQTFTHTCCAISHTCKPFTPGEKVHR